MNIRGHSADSNTFSQMTERMLNLPESPYVAKVIACYEDESYYYTIMENLGGDDLYSFCHLLHPKKTSSMELPTEVLFSPEEIELEVRKIMFRMLKALQHLHVQGLIHRDVKLENFVFKEKGDIVESVGSFFSCCSGDSSKVSRAFFVTLGVVGRYQEILIGSFSSVPRLIFCK